MSTWHTAAGRPRLQSMLLVRAIPLQAILDSAGPATIEEVSALVPLSITLVPFSFVLASDGISHYTCSAYL